MAQAGYFIEFSISFPLFISQRDGPRKALRPAIQIASLGFLGEG